MESIENYSDVPQCFIPVYYDKMLVMMIMMITMIIMMLTMMIIKADSARIRSDIESRNTKLNADKERFERLSEEYGSKLASLQSLYDQQSETIRLLELQQESNEKLILDHEMKLNEMVGRIG